MHSPQRTFDCFPRSLSKNYDNRLQYKYEKFHEKLEFCYFIPCFEAPNFDDDTHKFRGEPKGKLNTCESNA